MGQDPLRETSNSKNGNGLGGPGPIARLAVALALALPLLIGGLLAWHSLGDADIWLHHRIGRDLLAGRGQPANADFTFSSPDREWANHETLFQVLIAPLGPDPSSDGEVSVSGWSALRLALVLFLVGALTLGERRWRVFRGGSFQAATAWLGPALLMTMMLLWSRLILRPELISYLLFVLVLRAIETALAEPDPAAGIAGRLRAGLDPRNPAGRLFWLTLVWAWAHGFSALVPVLWIAGALLAPWQRRLAGLRPVPADWAGRGLTLILLLVALMATPNGPAGVLQPLRALGQFGQDTVDLQHMISELVPLLETANALHGTLLAFQLSLAWAVLVVVLGWGRISLLRLAVFGLAAGAAFLGQRNLGFYAVAFCLLHTGWQGLAPGASGGVVPPMTRLVGRLPAALRGRHAFAAAAITLAVAGFWAPRIVGDDFYLREGVSRRFGAGLTPAVAPLDGASHLGRLGVERAVANLAAAAPALDFSPARLFIDGRTEAHSPADWARYGRILRGGEDALAELGNLAPGAVLVSSTGTSSAPLIATLLASADWRIEWLGLAGWLFVPGSAGGPDAAIPRAEALERELLSGPDPLAAARYADFCLAQSRIWKQTGRIDRQEKILRAGLQRRPDHPTLLHNLGNIVRERGDHATALELYAGALAVNPRLAATALNQGACLMALRRFDQAAASFERCLRIDPEMFQAWVNLGLARQQAGDAAAAREAFARALELRPNDQRLRQFLRQRR